VSASEGTPISKHSAGVLQDRGVFDRLSSKPATDEAIQWADLILTMTASHKELLIRRFPEAVDKVYTLKEYAEDDPAVVQAVETRNQLVSELHIKQALGQPITSEDIDKLRQLESTVPSFDISDPFGGDRALYEQCADEIQLYVHKLIRKF
jgi:protein-tyrosine phosphatase